MRFFIFNYENPSMGVDLEGYISWEVRTTMGFLTLLVDTVSGETTSQETYPTTAFLNATTTQKHTRIGFNLPQI